MGSRRVACSTRSFATRQRPSTIAELRRAYTIGLRRLAKPTLVRGIAGLLPRRPELRDALHDVLLRLGPDGAEALIDLLTAADSLTDRRAYLAALVKCRDAVPTLIHLLGDKRWYVVRNTTDLLGEMRAVGGGERTDRDRDASRGARSPLGRDGAVATWYGAVGPGRSADAHGPGARGTRARGAGARRP